MSLSKRAESISLSITLALDARAKELAAGGRDVINMSVGEPDFDAPRVAREAAAARALEGPVRYTPAAGAAELRATIAAHLTEARGVPFEPAEVTVCHSTKHALSGSVLALVDPGDEVLLLVPAWVSYFEIVRLAGGTPVAVSPRPDCGPDLDAIRAAITPRTKAVLLNTPSNPTGYVWSKSEMRAFTDLCLEHDLWMISDEIYRRLVYEGEPNPSPVELGPEARARTVVLDGASKAYAMTGYRIGYLAAPTEVSSAVTRLHSHLTGCPNAISQAAFRAALESDPPEVAAMVREFAARRTFLLGELTNMGLPAPPPRGAFYAFPNVEPYLDERGATGFCEDLLEEQDLALVPGSAFGDDRHVRLSYALSLERIREATERLRAFVASRTVTS
jgi:aspartate aminotransferase